MPYAERRISQKTFDLHIGESSWDAECLRAFNIIARKQFLHNDYFEKNSLNNNRILKTLKIFLSVLAAFVRSEKVVFTSINSDAMLVQLAFIFYTKCFFFIPNVCGYKKERHLGARLYRLIINSYSDRVLVSDEVSLKCLQSIKPTAVDNYFRLSTSDSLPSKHKANFIVVLPAPETHKDSLPDADLLYDFHIEIYRYLVSHDMSAYFLLHPRNRGHTEEKLRKENISAPSIIASQDIGKLENVIYISGFSSLCLNKRYGGAHGIWVSINGRNILKNEFEDCTEFLVELEELT